MIRFDIITAVPELLESPLGHSILQRAKDRGLIEVHCHDLKQYGKGKHRQIDDYQYGGGAGMVIMPEPLGACIDDLMDERTYDAIIYMTPDAPVFTQSQANKLSLGTAYIIITGHYKGIDHRIRSHYNTLDISIGDYVLSGGELPAAVLVDAVSRLVPGVLNDGMSALTDSHQDQLLAPEVYTRPESWKGHDVPDILLSGHEAKIDAWREENAKERTQSIRPDLWDIQ